MYTPVILNDGTTMGAGTVVHPRRNLDPTRREEGPRDLGWKRSVSPELPSCEIERSDEISVVCRPLFKRCASTFSRPVRKATPVHLQGSDLDAFSLKLHGNPS